ncbi:MAG: ribokinase, partial [Proteus mirabilis]
YVHTGNIEEALNKAVMFSGLSVTGKGTQSSYPSIEEFSEFLSSAK